MAENLFSSVGGYYGKKNKKAILIDNIICECLDNDYCLLSTIPEIIKKINTDGISVSKATVERHIRAFRLTKKFFLSSDKERELIKEEYSKTKDKKSLLLGIESLLQKGITSWEQVKKGGVNPLPVKNQPVVKTKAKKISNELDKLGRLDKIQERILNGMGDFFREIRNLYKNSERKSMERLDDLISLNAEINGMAIFLDEKRREFSKIKEERDFFERKCEEMKKEKRILQQNILDSNKKLPNRRRRNISPVLSA
ncbi:MAG: hypothetical protein WA055_00425 [Candidatus Moraniibacteriota bacterium]